MESAPPPPGRQGYPSSQREYWAKMASFRALASALSCLFFLPAWACVLPMICCIWSSILGFSGRQNTANVKRIFTCSCLSALQTLAVCSPNTVFSCSLVCQTPIPLVWSIFSPPSKLSHLRRISWHWDSRSSSCEMEITVLRLAAGWLPREPLSPFSDPHLSSTACSLHRLTCTPPAVEQFNHTVKGLGTGQHLAEQDGHWH